MIIFRHYSDTYDTRYYIADARQSSASRETRLICALQNSFRDYAADGLRR